ncbi:hypothetical protein [Methanobrevibacter millerae]|uniref:Molecular chaperone DnaJ n=1 Tax=Methanobrevibacter millerae TaxID=230361 RepID=A0A1G5VPZ4_9EURY|nr:hypothetical protein [Methanobrevibacter millerae]SDA47929.1 hypothetical protein SAMN02910315_00773 [Methanobrevibacter millerae]
MSESEIKELKEQLMHLIFEYDDLVSHVCPDIEVRYVLEFGMDEYELYEIELEIEKLERKLELIEAESNVDLNKIDKKLDKEFEESERQLKAQINEINYLKGNELKRLSPEDLQKLRQTYLMLIEKLHPDLNPNQNFLDLSLFIKAENSFKTDDLEALESVTRILPEEDNQEMPEIEDLKGSILEFEGKIYLVENEYPYNKKELLDDEDCGNEYREMLSELVDDRKEELKRLENKIDERLKNQKKSL